MSNEIIQNQYEVVIGTDSTEVEREYHLGVNQFVTQKTGRQNPDPLFAHVKKFFYDNSIGKNSGDYQIKPYVEFYTPLRWENFDFAVWGICADQPGGGRAHAYMHYHVDEPAKLNGKDFFRKIFGAEYLTANAVAQTNPQEGPKTKKTVRDVQIPMIQESERNHICQIMYQLCQNKVAVVKLPPVADFNSAAHEILLNIYALLPSRMRKNTGFATFITQETFRRYENLSSSNIRILIVDSNFAYPEGTKTDVFSMINLARRDHVPNKDALWAQIMAWSMLDQSNREEQAVELDKSLSNTPLTNREYLDKLLELNKQADALIAQLNQDAKTHSVPDLRTLCSIYKNEPLFAVVPRAAAAFKSSIARFLPEGVRFENLLLEEIDRSKTDQNLAKYAIQELVPDIKPFYGGIGKKFWEKNDTITANNATIAAQDSEIKTLQTGIAKQKEDYEGQLATQKTQYETRLTEQKTASDAQLAAQKKDYEAQIAACNETIKAKTVEIEALNRRIGEMEAAIAEKDASIADLTAKLKVADEKLKTLAEEIAALKQKCEELEADNAAKVGEIQKLSAELQTVQDKLSEVEGRIASYQSQVKTAQEEAARAKDELAKRDQTVAQLTEAADHAKAALDAKERELEKVKKENKLLRDKKMPLTFQELLREKSFLTIVVPVIGVLLVLTILLTVLLILKPGASDEPLLPPRDTDTNVSDTLSDEADPAAPTDTAADTVVQTQAVTTAPVTEAVTETVTEAVTEEAVTEAATEALPAVETEAAPAVETEEAPAVETEAIADVETEAANG